MRKILQIRLGEYLLGVKDNGISTTYSESDALDISNWSMEQLGAIINGLKSAGFKKAKILRMEETEIKDVSDDCYYCWKEDGNSGK